MLEILFDVLLQTFSPAGSGGVKAMHVAGDIWYAEHQMELP